MSTEQEETPAEVAARMTAERQWPVTVTLATPVDFGSQHIEAIEFRRGCMGDLKGLTPGETPTFDQLILLASRMCGQPVKVIEKLGADDIGEVVQIALGFFMRSLAGGRRR
jgi:hypothetical protein